MPFLVVPVKGGYKVKKAGTTETYSKHALPKAVAVKQQRAIYSHSRSERLKKKM